VHWSVPAWDSPLTRLACGDDVGEADHEELEVTLEWKEALLRAHQKREARRTTGLQAAAQPKGNITSGRERQLYKQYGQLQGAKIALHEIALDALMKEAKADFNKKQTSFSRQNTKAE